MRTTKSSRSEVTATAELVADVEEAHELLEIYRVLCPECGQRIGLLADEEQLPEHAMLPTAHEPFGMTVCRASGTPSARAEATDEREVAEQDAAVLLTLPAGLDWRTQPFSHAGPVVPAQARRG
ncbi:hypothetical protein JGS22_021015 [Streptomyces sp. P38-E01]|uniref:Uncharacterized protein n=1 Tax=Streptomyces tardus TaxID=2780544 RepID=A0A949JJU0_9ACTN|nr:hypothetical protein [Streptomyces tardus]MBU7600044.1 hypothetical protein [Streptomyces tardus]